METYCFSCHSGKEPDGDVGLDKYKDFASLRADLDTWRTVHEMLDDLEMPPEDSPAPSDSERDAVIRWLEAATAEKNGDPKSMR